MTLTQIAWRRRAGHRMSVLIGAARGDASSDKELDLLSNPLWAPPPEKGLKKKEVQSSDSEVDLFAPPPTAPVPWQKVKGEKALPCARVGGWC